MNNGLTVNDLYKLCKEQVAKGNGDKVILISDDDEGNGFHTLYYSFTDELEDIKEFAYNNSFHDDNNPDDVILLG